MSRLTRISLTHRAVVMLLTLLTIGFGIYTTTALKQELLPSLTIPRASVIAAYPGAGPEAVEREVTQPLEGAVSAVAGVTSVTSRSSSGVAQVVVEWEFGEGDEEVTNALRTAMDAVAGSLPDDVEPRLVVGSFDDLPVMALAVSSDADSDTLAREIEDRVVPRLKGVEGVRDVTVSGEEQRQVVVTARADDLKRLGVDPGLVPQFFAANANAVPAGTLRTGTANLDVQVGTTFSSVDQVENLRLQGTDGPVRLADVADVQVVPVDSTSVSRVNGEPSLTVAVTKTPDGNTVAVARDVRAELDDLDADGTLRFATVFDQSPFIEQSIHDLSVEGGLGLAMAIFVILLFLRSLRPTVITAISIPLSLLIALVALWLADYTLNILTLGALTVAIGRVVDDSIVVIENIKRHQGLGHTGPDGIVRAVREVAGAVTSSTLTTVAVFLPIGLVGGQAGQMFRPFAVTVTVALLASLLVSLTVVPVLASWFMGRRARDLVAEEEDHDTLLQRAYLPALTWALGHRGITLALAFAVFAGTLALAPRLKTDFIGDAGMSTLQVSQKLPSGTSLEETDAAARRVEEVLAAEPGVETYQTTVGGSTGLSLFGAQADTNEATFQLTLRPGEKGSVVADRLRGLLAQVPDAGTIEVAVGEGAASQVVVYVETSDPDRLAAANEEVLAMMRGLDGLSAVTSDLSQARAMLQVDVSESRAAAAGLTQVQVGLAATQALRGQPMGSIDLDDSSLPVVLRSGDPATSVSELKRIPLPVTQKQTMDARLAAAEEVEAQQKAMQNSQVEQAERGFAESLAQLAENRAKAKQQERELGAKLRELEALLARPLPTMPAPAAPVPTVGVPTTPVPTASAPPGTPGPSAAPSPAQPAPPAVVLPTADPLATVRAQAAQLREAIAAARAQVAALDTQAEKLREQRANTEASRVQGEQIAQAAKDAQKATADPLRLEEVATVDEVDAPAVITRVDGARTASITASPTGTDLGATTSALQAGLDSLNLGDGVTARIGGVSQQQQESFRQLGLAMLVAIGVVYLIMVATFGSLLQPLILLVSVPFAATGALGLLLLTDTPLGVPAMIGLLMLIGIVVTNAIVLIDLINQYRERGAGIDEAIRQGARLRLRPIVMTALATIMALVPMGLGVTGGGVFISKPLAIVVIGGLVSSTVLTLILVPVLYDLVEKLRARGAQRRAARREAVERDPSVVAGADAAGEAAAG